MCQTTVIFGTLKDGSLQIISLALKIVSATETFSKMASCFVKNRFKKTQFFVKKIHNFL